MSNRSAGLSRKTRVMEWSSTSMEQSTLKKHGIDYDPKYVFGQGIGKAGGFLDAAGRCRPPPGLGIYVAFDPALPGWATLCRASGAGLSMVIGAGLSMAPGHLNVDGPGAEFLAGMGQSRKNLG